MILTNHNKQALKRSERITFVFIRRESMGTFVQEGNYVEGTETKEEEKNAKDTKVLPKENVSTLTEEEIERAVEAIMFLFEIKNRIDERQTSNQEDIAMSEWTFEPNIF